MKNEFSIILLFTLISILLGFTSCSETKIDKDFKNPDKLVNRTFVTYNYLSSSSNIGLKALNINEIGYIYFLIFIDTKTARIVSYTSYDCDVTDGEWSFNDMERISDETLSFVIDSTKFSMKMSFGKDPFTRVGYLKFSNSLRIGEWGIRKSDGVIDESVVLFDPEVGSPTMPFKEIKSMNFPKVISTFTYGNAYN
ncbi:MAG: hypothetical protein H8E98_03750 [Bacteroidetes bacterium]|nr:hypothetical protein [Bacteroidota bacterium]